MMVDRVARAQAAGQRLGHLGVTHYVPAIVQLVCIAVAPLVGRAGHQVGHRACRHHPVRAIAEGHLPVLSLRLYPKRKAQPGRRIRYGWLHCVDELHPRLDRARRDAQQHPVVRRTQQAALARRGPGLIIAWGHDRERRLSRHRRGQRWARRCHRGGDGFTDRPALHARLEAAGADCPRRQFAGRPGQAARGCVVAETCRALRHIQQPLGQRVGQGQLGQAGVAGVLGGQRKGDALPRLDPGRIGLQAQGRA